MPGIREASGRSFLRRRVGARQRATMRWAASHSRASLASVVSSMVVTDDLVGESASIPASSLRVITDACERCPLGEEQVVASGLNGEGTGFRYALAISVPPGTPAGTYRGTVRITASTRG